MEFFSTLLLAISGLFGFSVGSEPVLAPEPVQSSEVAAVDDSAISTEEVVGEQLGVIPPVPVEATPSYDEMLGDSESTVNEVTSEPAAQATPAAPAFTPPDVQTVLVAGGCFWCTESDLEKTPGVFFAVSGYAGGSTENPTYKDYGSGGHREVVEVTYDANKVSFEDLLIVTMKTTDPTDDDGTFNDRGDKYSAAFYYETPEQKQIIESLIAEVDEFGPYDKPLAIDVEPRPSFWPAEDNHQDYYKGTLTSLKYKYYRNASGRNDFIERYWGTDTSPRLPWRQETSEQTLSAPSATPLANNFWMNYIKPTKEELQQTLEPIAYKVTQEDGTERAGTSPLDKNWEPGIYVDILSGEPLYSSKDKYDSGTGWPSFVKPITDDALTLHEDRKLFSVRTETRSTIADNHIGHVFDDGPADRGGKRYCMNGVALRFVPKADMEAEGYAEYLQYVD